MCVSLGYKCLATIDVKPISKMINDMMMLDLSACKTKKRLLNINIYCDDWPDAGVA